MAGVKILVGDDDGDGKMACITMAGVTFTCVVLVISTLVDGGDMDGGEVNVAVHIG